MAAKLLTAAGGGITLDAASTATDKTLTLPAVTGVAMTASSNADNAQFNTITGTAPLYSARAWVNFNGTGTVAIRASGNVSSVTDNGTGDYTVNFTTAMPDANYSMTGSIRNTQTYAQIQVGSPVIAQSTTPTTSALRITTPTIGDNNNRANIDSDYVSVAIFR